MDFLSLDNRLLKALREDIGRGDVTTESIAEFGAFERTSEARVVAKEELVLAGWPVFVRVFELLGPVEVRAEVKDGTVVSTGSTVGCLRASAHVLLRGERVALNLLQRMSGVASLTRQYVQAIAGTRAAILDTRKTTPLWRDLEKYAVRVGGGVNHRQGLDDGILIKENHIAWAGGITAAINACLKRSSHLQKIEIEVTDLDQLREALEAGAEIVLLDNMTVEQVRDAVRFSAGRCLLEVSGGVNLQSIRDYAETGIDFISVGALTHSYRARDISMLFGSHV